MFVCPSHIFIWGSNNWPAPNRAFLVMVKQQMYQGMNHETSKAKERLILLETVHSYVVKRNTSTNISELEHWEILISSSFEFCIT